MHPRNPFNNIVIIGDEPLTHKQAIGFVGVATSFQNLNEAVRDSWNNAVNMLIPMFPTINKNYICNIVTSIGNSMNGQAWSKTFESTSIINILEDSLKIIKAGFRI